MAQTEVHPIKPGCRYLRGRYKLLPSTRSPFPERVLLRFECQEQRPIEDDAAAYKCEITVSGCWQDGTGNWTTQEGKPTELPSASDEPAQTK